MIPSFELRTQYQQMKSEMLEALSRVLDKGQFILGPEVEAFEEEFKNWNGSSYAVGVGSGTEALHIALRALDIGPGDEVICPTFTYVATVSAVALTGATPVFVDIDPQTYCMQLSEVQAKITPRTKAIVAVHLYGHPADLLELRRLADKHHLALIEDCAQATGAEIEGKKVGTRGDLGCFSFFPTKNLGGYGDGGMVTSEKADLYNKVKMIRTHGQGAIKYHHEIIGTNSRLDEIQATILRIKLRRLDQWNDSRRHVAQTYAKSMRNSAVILPSEAQGCRHVYHQYTVRSSERPALMQHLKNKGVGCTVYYPVSLHLQQAFQNLGHRLGQFPQAEAAQEQVLSLPMYPELSSAQIEEIAEAINSFQAVSPPPALVR